MERITEMVGKPVMSAANGDKLGSVADFLVTIEGDRVLGIVMRRGALRGEQVLPYDAVQAVGRHALIARSEDRVMRPREWYDRGIEAERSSTLKDKRVMTDDGRQLGHIREVYVDGPTGMVRGYEVEGRGVAGLIARRAALPRTAGMSIGPDAVIVPDDAARVFEAEEHHPRRE
jgi:uncharacterized protein YrrD